MPPEQKVLIVGGSLVGLTFALACAKRGIRTCVVDQAGRYDRDGAALGVDRSLLLKTLGATSNVRSENANFPALTDYRQALSWKALHSWLRSLAANTPQVSFQDGYRIIEVMQNDTSATAVTAHGHRIKVSVIVGADGYRSVVRRDIHPEQPEPLYAGYLLWRGLIPEACLPVQTDWPLTNDGVALVNDAGYRLVAYPVAGYDGRLVPGKRLISFAWYDKTRNALLREAGCVSSAGHVLSSLLPASVPERTRCELKGLALRIWPEPWRSTIVHALEQNEVFATPVAEYDPKRLHRGRLAIIGDAAHVVSPATGMGFVAGVLDAEALADALNQHFGRTADGSLRALEEYGRKRLVAAQQLAARSREWSRAYLSGTELPGRVKHQKFVQNKT